MIAISGFEMVSPFCRSLNDEGSGDSCANEMHVHPIIPIVNMIKNIIFIFFIAQYPNMFQESQK